MMVGNESDPLYRECVFADPRRVAIVGAGLLGGSFGLAIRKRFAGCEVVGVSRSSISREQAVSSGAVTSATDEAGEACEGADLVCVAIPVDGIAAAVVKAVKNCHADGMVIDLGSTKTTIVRAIDGAPLAAVKFVGTHPIAGSEKTGAANARADLFVGKTVVITPGKNTPSGLVNRARGLWQSLGAKVMEMSPEEHDIAMASVSHVPHLVASMLAGTLRDQTAGLVGTGWLDLTRVASGDPQMWAAICRENPSAISAELARAGQWLSRLRAAIDSGDFASVERMLVEAKVVRDHVASRQK